MRIAVGMAGLATLSALGTAILAPQASVSAGAATDTAASVTAGALPVRVQHVTRYVQLAPGQSPPPNAPVQPVATPQPKVVIVTRQSGTH